MDKKSQESSRYYNFLTMEQIQNLCGAYHSNLYQIEQLYDVSIFNNGEGFLIKGEKNKQAVIFLDSLVNLAKENRIISSEIIENIFNLQDIDNKTVYKHQKYDNVTINTKRKNISVKNELQFQYVNALANKDIVFSTGPAGTGKTYLAVAKAVEFFIKGKFDKIILSRPAVEAGEQLGFLPGSLQEKVNPYLRPLYDALDEMLPAEIISSNITDRKIEIVPIAFMRGRTFNNSFVILDEAQNATLPQLKMLLTRLGNKSKLVVTGDVTQVDLPFNVKSGLPLAINILKNLNEVGIIEFSNKEVVRSDLVQKVVCSFEKYERNQSNT